MQRYRVELNLRQSGVGKIVKGRVLTGEGQFVSGINDIGNGNNFVQLAAQIYEKLPHGEEYTLELTSPPKIGLSTKSFPRKKLRRIAGRLERKAQVQTVTVF